MKKLNVFELKQVSGGASIAPIAKFPKDPKDFFILGARVPEHPITYEDLMRPKLAPPEHPITYEDLMRPIPAQ